MGINSAREHHTLSVELCARSYPILISSGCVEKLTEKKIDLQKDGRKIVALVYDVAPAVEDFELRVWKTFDAWNSEEVVPGVTIG